VVLAGSLRHSSAVFGAGQISFVIALFASRSQNGTEKEEDFP
jgi:hypothetical protein